MGEAGGSSLGSRAVGDLAIPVGAAVGPRCLEPSALAGRVSPAQHGCGAQSVAWCQAKVTPSFHRLWEICHLAASQRRWWIGPVPAARAQRQEGPHLGNIRAEGPCGDQGHHFGGLA